MITTAEPVRRCLSTHQRGLLALEAQQPGSISSRYTVNVVLRLRGPLDLDVLAAAYDDVVASHEILRTRLVPGIAGEDGYAEVLPHERVAIEVIDDSGPDEALERWDATGIDPACPPLIRCCLVRLDHDHHLLALVLSHTVADATTLGLAVERLAEAYEARLRGERAAVPDRQYADHAEWETRRARERGEHDRAAWERVFRGVAPPGYRRDVPFVAGRPPAQRTLTMPLLDAAEARALSERSWRARSTLFTMLFAAFARTMRAEAARDDLLLLTWLERRDHPDARRMLGPFTALAPVRLRIAGDEAWDATPGQVRDAMLEARGRIHTPLLKLLPLAPALVPGLIGLEPSWVRCFHFVPATYPAHRFGTAGAEVVRHGDGLEGGAGLGLGAWPAQDGTLLVRASYDANDLHEETVRRLVEDIRRHATCFLTT